MSPQEAGTSPGRRQHQRQAKGHWVFGGPYDRRGLGLIKPGTANRSQGQGRSSEQTKWSWGGCELALELWAIWEGSLTTGQHFEPDLRNSAVRDYRGAAGNVAMVEL